MSFSGKWKPAAATIVAATAAVAVAGLLFASGARTEDLKSYASNNKNFWLHPPDDWFMGDETQELKGTNYLKTLPPPTGFTKDEIEAKLKEIKLPPGFKIELWASGVTDARQMAGATRARCSSGRCLAETARFTPSSTKAANGPSRPSSARDCGCPAASRFTAARCMSPTSTRSTNTTMRKRTSTPCRRAANRL